MDMNKSNQKAVERLHNFLADSGECSEQKLRVALEEDGVNVDAFLTRLSQEAGIKLADSGKRPSAAERLRKLAGKASSKMATLLESLDRGEAGMPVGAYGRSGRKGKKVAPRRKGDQGSKG